MQKYELVLMLDYKGQDSDRKDLLSKFENLFKDNIIKKDDIGLKDLSHNLKGKQGDNRAYLFSYYIDCDTSTLQAIKESFLYSNIVVRYNVFKMKQDQVFLEFEKLQKELEDIMEAWDDKKFGNRISFLSHKDNEKYINWKSVVILKKYLTRFGNIKPRRYTKNSVKTQKQLRKEIIRARGLGLLEFIRR